MKHVVLPAEAHEPDSDGDDDSDDENKVVKPAPKMPMMPKMPIKIISPPTLDLILMELTDTMVI